MFGPVINRLNFIIAKEQQNISNQSKLTVSRRLCAMKMSVISQRSIKQLCIYKHVLLHSGDTTMHLLPPHNRQVLPRRNHTHLHPPDWRKNENQTHTI